MMRYFLPIGVVLGLIGAARSQDEEPQFRFHKGDAVRFNCINSENRMPTTTPIWKTTDELEESLARQSKAFATGQPFTPEEVVFVGHNTRATVIDLALVRWDGSRIEAERVTLESGTLKGEEF
jgi:hypothetical protein